MFDKIIFFYHIFYSDYDKKKMYYIDRLTLNINYQDFYKIAF